MHTRSMLPARIFDIEVDGKDATLETIFPGFDLNDRFGIVIDEPFGTRGASLLIQAAISQFYAIPRDDQFPEIYLFHLGGPHGDHSNFDFWPPRREVKVPAGRPDVLLDRINDYGITRFALPERGLGALEVLEQGKSSWAEQSSARERVRSSFVYSPSGSTDDADVMISTETEGTEENFADSLDLLGAVDRLTSLSDDDFAAKILDAQGDFATAQDAYNWADSAKSRATEIPSEITDLIAASRQEKWRTEHRLSQSFRQITIDEALSRVAGLDAAREFSGL